MLNRSYTLFVILCLFSNCLLAQGIHVEKKQAEAAFKLLNSIRENPQKYKKELQLSGVDKVQTKALVWNKKLAKVAEDRAKDMAKRSYFDHTDPDGLGPNVHISKAGYTLNESWLKKPNANNFESIAANWANAEDAIRGLIIGKNSPGFMHRKHLLGMDDWNASLYDVGIGFVTVPEGKLYKSYLCVIIAKHDW